MTWQRLEAGAVDPAIEEGIAAGVADPLWFLARQWQVGEFRGEDAASPVLIEAVVRAAPVIKYWTEDDDGTRTTVPRQQLGVPLEALAEREPITTGPAAIRLRLESGAALLRRLAQSDAPRALLAELRGAYPLSDLPDDSLDPVGHARLRLLARHSLDADAVLAALAGAGGDPAALPELASLPERPRTRAAGVVAGWQRHEALLFSEIGPGDPSAWSARRLEYRFGVTAAVPGGDVIELAAPEYPGGWLDWHHFDVATYPEPAGSEPASAPSAEAKHIRVLPIPLQFAGMPASRWWEFEDGDAYFGDLAGGPDDLARSVVAAYSAVAGEDWFSVPCTLPTGSVAQVVRVRVLDDFGRWTSIPAAAAADDAAGDRPWRWFELHGDPSPARGDAPLLFLPPVIDTVQQGRSLEAVEFRRDELANMAWAIERHVESMAGRPVDRDAGARAEPLAPAPDDAWRYQLATDVPDHWVPLVPVRIRGDRPDVVLRRGRIAASEDPAEANVAKGRILEPEQPFLLCEEELPAGGLRVTRRYQLARSSDGGVHLWTGRRKQPSGGPMKRTPLRFDATDFKPTTAAPS